jgi:hypothetical protein
MTAVAVTLAVFLGLSLTVCVILRAGYDRELAARKAAEAAADERFRDGFRAGFASAAAVQDAGLSVLRGALR